MITVTRNYSTGGKNTFQAKDGRAIADRFCEERLAQQQSSDPVTVEYSISEKDFNDHDYLIGVNGYECEVALGYGYARIAIVSEAA